MQTNVKFTKECVMCTENRVFVKKIFANELNYLKTIKMVFKIKKKNRPDTPAMVSWPEMVDSVNTTSLVDRRITIEQWGISVATAHKIVPDNKLL